MDGDLRRHHRPWLRADEAEGLAVRLDPTDAFQVIGGEDRGIVSRPLEERAPRLHRDVRIYLGGGDPPETVAWPADVLVDTWLLASRYLELSLLQALAVNAPIRSRLSANRWRGATPPPPWARGTAALGRP